MFNNADNEDAVPAKLTDGESILPEGFLETNKDLVEELQDKNEESTEPSVEVEDKPVVEDKKFDPKPVKPELVKEKEVKTEKKSDTSETLAVHSTRNVTWSGVGKVYIGYNIVTKEQADKWLTRDHIRLATPQEVAKEFGL